MDKNRLLLLAFRQALLMMVGAIETYLGMERSKVPNHVK
jgi:hypothetical protein